MARTKKKEAAEPAPKKAKVTVKKATKKKKKVTKKVAEAADVAPAAPPARKVAVLRTVQEPPEVDLGVATTPPQAGSVHALIEIQKQAIERTTYANARMLTANLTPVEFAGDIAALKRLDRCIELQNVRGSQTAELACHLFNLREGGWAEAAAPVGDLPAAEDFKQVVDTRLNMSPAKANKLASQWASFLTLGVSTGVLSQVVWDRLCELGPGIRAGVIDEDNIAEWLPFCEPLGKPYALRSVDLQRAVKDAIFAADPESEGSDPTLEKMRTLRLTMTQANCELYLSFQELLKRATAQASDANYWPSDGEVVVEALAAQTSMLAEGGEAGWRDVGMARFKEVVELVCPGVSAVFIAPSDDPNFVPNHIGLETISAVYQGFAPGPDGSEQLRFVVARGPAEAAATLGIDVSTVREFPLLVSNELRTRVEPHDTPRVLPVSAPLAPLSTAADDEDEPEALDDLEDAQEPAEPATEPEDTVPPPVTERPVYKKLSSAKQRALASTLGSLCREHNLAETPEFAARKEAAIARFSNEPDVATRNLLVYTEVVDWLFDLIDEAGLTVDVPTA